MFVVFKILSREVEPEKEVVQEPLLKTASTNDLLDGELARRERMRTEANQLQAELGRIKKEPLAINRVEKMARWKLKSEIHHELYADLYEMIGEFGDDVGSGIVLVDRVS